MRLFTRQHIDMRCPKESARLDVPAHTREHGVSRGSERGEVRNRGAGYEGAAGASGKLKQIDQPAQRHDLKVGDSWRGRVKASVLIPGSGQPICGQCLREGAADDKAEESRAGNCKRRRRYQPIEQRERLSGVTAGSAERFIQLPQRGDRGWVRRDRSLVQSFKIGARPARGIIQNRVRHRSPFFLQSAQLSAGARRRESMRAAQFG